MSQGSAAESLQGTIERVTFHSEASGFCVLRVKVRGHRELVTVVGNAATIGAGEVIDCTGIWIQDKRHGLQFKAQTLELAQPTSLAGMQKYLASGMIRGIGPHFARKLIQAFGEDVFTVIEKTPERLAEVGGIGKSRREQIIRAWDEQRAIRGIMVFLQQHGVGTARAVRIYKTYGDHAVELVKENPYRLALDIRGIGFKTADDLAMQLGIAKDSLIRVQAGVRHALQQLCDFGHCASEYGKLVEATYELLQVNQSVIKDAILLEVEAGNLVAEEINGEPCVYLAALYQAETSVAEELNRVRCGKIPWGKLNPEKVIPWAEKQTGLTLSESQATAVATVLRQKLAIITGGPGVGKTTIVNSILKIIRAQKVNVALCAPTGRAAKRLSESTGMEAKTIHRLLEFDPMSYGFRHNEDEPLKVDLLVVDEASMIDIVLMNNLLKAVPDEAAVLFVGDVDQLPSVGPGAVLADMINSEKIPTVKLTEIFRQAADSKIIINAHRINEGEMPLPNAGEGADFFTLYVDSPEQVHDKLVQLVTERVPKKFNCDPINDIQVLTPMNRSGLGSRALNVALQEKLNGEAQPKVNRYGWHFSPGDKVLQTVNNYDKEVFNGDIGLITTVNLEDQCLYVDFEGREVEYTFNDLDELSLAYATTIHKSQGSEYPIVILPLAMQHFMLLARNLLYTGVTRGKQLVILVGQKRAVELAVSNHNKKKRLTKLAARI
jgi:exodeoxyribonuclease V alpha subunit